MTPTNTTQFKIFRALMETTFLGYFKLGHGFGLSKLKQRAIT